VIATESLASRLDKIACSVRGKMRIRCLLATARVRARNTITGAFQGRSMLSQACL
jgi:hypothetical protein